MAGSISWDLFARDHASATFDKVGRSVEKTQSRFSSFSKKAAIAGAVVGAALVKFGVTSVKAFVEAEASQKKLEDAYARFPRLADVNIASLRAQSKALENKTRFDDDAIVAAQAQLAQYKLTGTQLKSLTPLVVDYAARTGKDLPTAALAVGKAMLGNGKALKDVGIKFKDTGTTAGNFAELMTTLSAAVGGFATKEGATAEGRAETLKNKFGDLEETVGSFLLPTLEKLTTAGLAAVDWMNKHQTATKILVIAVAALTVGFVALTVAMAIFNAVAAANPFVLLVLGVAAVVVAIVILYKKFQVARDIINGVWTAIRIWITVNVAIIKALFIALVAAGKGIGAGVQWAWQNVIKPVLTGIGSKINAVKDTISTAIHVIQGLWKGIGNGLSTAAAIVKSILNGIASSIQAVSDALDALTNRGTAIPVGTQTGFASQAVSPYKPRRAAGGPVSAFHTYRVNERGEEWFTPGVSGTITPNNKLAGGGMSARAIANAVADALSGATFQFDGDGLATLVTKRQAVYAAKGPRR